MHRARRSAPLINLESAGGWLAASDVSRVKSINHSEDDGKHQILFDAAAEVLRRNYHPVRHSVGAAVLCASGRIYTGVNVEASGYGVCAEPVAPGAALTNGASGYGVCAEPVAPGAALTNGERDVLAVVAVCKRGSEYIVLSPCGDCRQMLLDYAPEADVVYMDARGRATTKAKNLLPGAYMAPDFGDI